MKINLKKPNHNYPSCLNVSCDHHALYSLGGVRVPDFEIWPVIDYRNQHMTANAWEDIGKELKINLKKPNHNYPSCLNVSCDHHASYSLGGVRVPDFEIWPVILKYIHLIAIWMFFRFLNLLEPEFCI